MKRALGFVAFVLLTAVLGVAVAGQWERWEWTQGQPAIGTAATMAPSSEGSPALYLPLEVSERIQQDRRLLLFYFAPTCSHCRKVAPEVRALVESFDGKVDVLGVATSRSTAEDLAAFEAEFGWSFETIIDTEAEISAAIGAKQTPVALLLERTAPEETLFDQLLQDKDAPGSWRAAEDGRGTRQDRRKGAVRVLKAYRPFKPRDSARVRMVTEGNPFGLLMEPGYKGNAVCAECHIEEHRAWELSHHSVAWRTLVLAKGSRNPECTNCHVTGAGEPGGWPGIGSREMIDVGCEACHSANGPHDGQVEETRTTCVGCHDDKHSINFSFDKGLPHIDHYTAVGLSDEAHKERRQALLGGEAPKPLLAFSDTAKWVGTKPCLACHEDTHAWWNGSGHGRAMATLERENAADKVECVKCHASPTVGGIQPTSLDKYRTADGGVGCESCHGPGGDHVKAGGGIDNIVGLGKSCPVCVTEAICTSCHTPKWDKDWELEPELARIYHGTADADSEEPAEPDESAP